MPLPTIRVQADRCSTCIYRPGNLMHLERGRRRQMERQAVANGSVIPCHQTLAEYTGSSAGLDGSTAYNVVGPEGRQAVCAGYFAAHHAEVQPLVVAVELRLVERVKCQDHR